MRVKGPTHKESLYTTFKRRTHKLRMYYSSVPDSDQQAIIDKKPIQQVHRLM